MLIVTFHESYDIYNRLTNPIKELLASEGINLDPWRCHVVENVLLIMAEILDPSVKNIYAVTRIWGKRNHKEREIHPDEIEFLILDLPIDEMKKLAEYLIELTDNDAVSFDAERETVSIKFEPFQNKVMPKILSKISELLATNRGYFKDHTKLSSEHKNEGGATLASYQNAEISFFVPPENKRQPSQQHAEITRAAPSNKPQSKP